MSKIKLLALKSKFSRCFQLLGKPVYAPESTTERPLFQSNISIFCGGDGVPRLPKGYCANVKNKGLGLHKIWRENDRNYAAIGSVLASRTPVFKSTGIDIFRSLRWTWMSLKLTHGDSRRMSAGLCLVQIITWWSRDDHVTTNAAAWAEAVYL